MDIIKYFLIVVAIGAVMYNSLLAADNYYANQEIINQELGQ